jgi:hypothetical protein
MQVTKEVDGTVVVPTAQNASPSEAMLLELHPPPREAQNQNFQAADASPKHKRGAAKVVLRPALDQSGRVMSLTASGHSEMEVQLGAWRSEGEANVGWDRARSRAGEALNGLNPHIVTADLPGRGRYYRLRVAVTAGQSRTAFCADLSAKGVACLPAQN